MTGVSAHILAIEAAMAPIAKPQSALAIIDQSGCAVAGEQRHCLR
jgi:hypothetical protein